MFLTDILLGSKPGHPDWVDPDIRHQSYQREEAVWSVKCNQARIGNHTVAWIPRFDGDYGAIEGVVLVEGVPWENKQGIWYLPGLIIPFPVEWRVDGARLALDGWDDVPYQNTKPYQTGRVLSDDNVKLIEARLERQGAGLLLDRIQAHRSISS